MAKHTTLKLQAFLPYQLSVTSNLVSDVIATAYQRLFSLRIPEWRLIAVIAESDGITQQAIGVSTRMDKVTVSRAAIALVERALIERRANPADGRSHLLHLTAAGRALYEQIAPKALELEKRIFDSFETGELSQFRAMLGKVDRAALEAVVRNSAAEGGQ